MTSGKVILLEFNELSPSLMARFISQGHLPNFKKFADQSATYITEAQERPPYLDPWIQWVTVHTGLNYTEHKLEHLDEGHTLSAKRIWDYVSDAGDPVWVCGSMNVGYQPGVKGAVMPDPWSSHVAPTPPELGAYFTFIQRNVQEYTNDRVPLSRADYLKFVAFMASHGLSSSTVTSIARQLLSEKRGVDRWKRAVILDKLQFDVFKAYYQKIQPRFSTFFLNSTAHYQHMYWRDMDPELFKVQPSTDGKNHNAAILFGYQQMDELLGQFVGLAEADTTIVFCTALSQQPYLKHEEEGGRHFYRPFDFDALVRFAGIEQPFTVSPVMAHQFHVYFETADAARAGEQALLSLQVDGRQAMAVTRKDLDVLNGCLIYDNLPEGTELVMSTTGQRAPFFDFFYKVEGMKSGMHHPDGLLWIRQPGRAPVKAESKVPLNAVAPTLMDLLGIPAPKSMSASLFPKRGASDPALVSI